MLKVPDYYFFALSLRFQMVLLQTQEALMLLHTQPWCFCQAFVDHHPGNNLSHGAVDYAELLRIQGYSSHLHARIMANGRSIGLNIFAAGLDFCQ